MKKRLIMAISLIVLTIPTAITISSVNNETQAFSLKQFMDLNKKPAKDVKEDHPTSEGATTYVEAYGLKYTKKSKIALNKARKAYHAAKSKSDKARAEYKSNPTRDNKIKMEQLIKNANKADEHLVYVMDHTKAQKKKK